VAEPDSKAATSSERPNRLRRFFRGVPPVLGIVASVIAIGGLAVGAVKALQSDPGRPVLPEGRQIIAFHQVASRICTENTRALRRAFPAARSRIELLAYLSRATGWGIDDLSGVTPPPRMEAGFAEEIENRRSIERDMLDLQKTIETGDQTGKARIGVELAADEVLARDLSHSLGLPRCAPVLPSQARASIAG
jgi:hypothetical protein